jgi:hypothetical protein
MNILQKTKSSGAVGQCVYAYLTSIDILNAHAQNQKYWNEIHRVRKGRIEKSKEMEYVY